MIDSRLFASTDLQRPRTKKCPADKSALPPAAPQAAPVQRAPPALLALPGSAGLLPAVRAAELRGAPGSRPGPGPQPVPDAAAQHECLSPGPLPDQPASAPPRPALPAPELPAQPANPHAAVAANHLTPNGAPGTSAFPAAEPAGWSRSPALGTFEPQCRRRQHLKSFLLIMFFFFLNPTLSNMHRLKA